MTGPGDIPMDDPLAYFLTWTTYGSWLPGNDRGRVEKPGNFMPADLERELDAAKRMRELGIALDPEQRGLVEKTIAEHCRYRKWYLHAVNCRTHHVHAVVTAFRRNPEVVLDQCRAWCTRRLKELAISNGDEELGHRTHWWSERGSKRQLFGESSLAAAIQYVIEDQDRPR